MTEALRRKQTVEGAARSRAVGAGLLCDVRRVKGHRATRSRAQYTPLTRRWLGTVSCGKVYQECDGPVRTPGRRPTGGTAGFRPACTDPVAVLDGVPDGKRPRMESPDPHGYPRGSIAWREGSGVHDEGHREGGPVAVPAQLRVYFTTH